MKSMAADSDTITDGYVPATLLHRDDHLRKIRSHLMSVIDRQPEHLWIHGRPGSGKTACVKSSLATAGCRTVVLNCWVDNTLFLLADRLTREWRVLDGHGMTTVSKLGAVTRFLDNRPAVIVLDELDKLPPRECGKALYALSTLGRIGLVCISNRLDGAWKLEERILSRLSPATLHFPPYSVPELARILANRFADCPTDVAEHAARLAAGDARVAIKLAMGAMRLASRESARPAARHVNDTFRGRSKPEDCRLSRMGEHEQCIYDLVKARDGIQSSELRQAYLHQRRQRGLDVVAERTFLKCLHRLRNAQLIRWRWLAGNGRRRSFSACSAQSGPSEASGLHAPK